MYCTLYTLLILNQFITGFVVNFFQHFFHNRALCCTDKKGILSWPNTSPEKVFILKSQKTLNPKAAAAATDVTSTKSDFVTTPTTETAKNATTEPHHATGASADIGKKHALKRYDHLVLNTSCFWGSTGLKHYPNNAI